MSATVQRPIRQPFGAVSKARLHQLSSTKNSQNAISKSQASPSKKADFSAINEIDLENVDPNILFSKSKGQDSDLDAGKHAFKPHIRLTTAKAVFPTASSSNISRKRKAEDAVRSGEKTESVKRRADPLSAPVVPIGRSPTRKHTGIKSRYRAGQSIGRIDPPGSSARVPFSLGAALAGTVPLKPKKKPHKKSWDFEIYEDTPTDEMANLMEHSTGILEISDDEGRSSPKADRDNKENTPPDTLSEVNASLRRQDSMTEDVRTPLGDLDAKSFYAEGCDETSVYIVPAESPAEDEARPANVSIDQALSNSKASAAAAPSTGQEGWENLLADLSARKRDNSLTDRSDMPADGQEGALDIQIWESESAKAENDTT